MSEKIVQSRSTFVFIDNDRMIRSLFSDYFLRFKDKLPQKQQESSQVKMFGYADQAYSDLQTSINSTTGVITDLNMHPMDGIDFITKVRQLDPLIPVAVYTNATPSDQRLKLILSLEKTRYLPKLSDDPEENMLETLQWIHTNSDRPNVTVPDQAPVDNQKFEIRIKPYCGGTDRPQNEPDWKIKPPDINRCPAYYDNTNIQCPLAKLALEKFGSMKKVYEYLAQHSSEVWLGDDFVVEGRSKLSVQCLRHGYGYAGAGHALITEVSRPKPLTSTIEAPAA
jgi:CheY-like chemotaxis protein